MDKSCEGDDNDAIPVMTVGSMFRTKFDKEDVPERVVTPAILPTFAE